LQLQALDNNNLTGSLPESLGDLSDLQVLDVSNNLIQGDIPESIGKFPALTHIFFQYNQMSGALPDTLGNITTLQYLNLRNNGFTGSIPASFGDLTNVTMMYLNSNALSGPIPASLGQLSKLTAFYLFSNQLTDSIPSQLGNLVNMKDFRLENNLLTGKIPGSLGNMKNLEHMYLHGNDLSGKIPGEFSRLENLLMLNLGGNLLSGPIPSGLGQLGKLQRLTLNSNSLSGPIPPELGNLSNLNLLNIYGNELSGPIPASLGNLKKLSQLLLYNNDLTGNIPTGLGQLGSLTNLVLFGNQLTGTIPASLGNLTNLTELKFQNNLLSGPVPASLGKLVNLKRLWLNSNQLAGPLPAEINSLGLTEFTLQYNYFTASDLLNVKAKLPSASSYHPQKSIGAYRAYRSGTGESLTLTVPEDRDMVPASEFQWFKGSQAVNPRSTSGHTLVLPNLTAQNSGNYTYKIWNISLPGLTLTSETQNVSVESPGWKSITVDLMVHNREEENTSTVNRTFLNTVPNTPYNISYELSGLGTELEGIGCQTCSFELEITLLDPDGKPVKLGDNLAGNTAADGYSYRNTYSVENCIVEQPIGSVEIGIPLAQRGEYTVSKELRLLTPDVEHARSEIESSDSFAGQLAALDSIYDSYGECVFCIPEDECPEAEEAISQAVAETAALECENIRQGIISDILTEKSTYTEQDIINHSDYCRYQNCGTNMEAAIFETEATLVKGWSSAGDLRSDMAGLDPFYNVAGLGGYEKKDLLVTALNNIGVGPYRASIYDITNPNNRALYFNAAGQPDPVNGVHVLYANVASQRAEMGETWYQQKMDEQRWVLFKNFYFEASRKIKLQIPAFRDCEASKEVLESIKELPTTEAGMQSWTVSNDIIAPVDSIQVDAVRYMLMGGCGGSFSVPDSNSLYAHLEAYFNSNRLTNPFNLLLEEDLLAGNPDLQAINTVLNANECSLAAYMVASPLVCLRDSLVFVDSPAQIAALNGTEEERKIYITEKEPYVDPSGPIWESTGQDIVINSLKEGGAEGLSMAPMSALPPNLSEFNALVALYTSTNGPGWNSKSGWEGADPNAPQDVTQWLPIVGMNGNGNVTMINLSYNSLSGPLPADIGNWGNLYSLELQRNGLNGFLPASVGSMTGLTHLNLSENSLSGQLPQGLANLTGLTYLDLSNNNFEGAIPIGSGHPGPINMSVALNRFTFKDLLPAKMHLDAPHKYSVQDSVDVGKNIHVPSGHTLVLTTNIDRNTVPASEYQWFRNGVAVNTRSVSGHTLTVSNATVSNSGEYYYKIWNSGLPALELTARKQNVLVYTGQPVSYCVEYGMGNAQGGYGQPDTNPSMELFSLPSTWQAIVDSCNADRVARAGALKVLAEEKLMQIRLEEYYAQYGLKCLDNIREEFSYTYIPREYHYTLYYYDQSGSLVRTVPPKGVQPMSNSQVALVRNGKEAHPAHTLDTRYRYNSRGQLTGQESPDAGESVFRYNKAGQLRLSQDARQAADNAYSYTKYDRQGRVTETGEFLSAEPADTLASKLEIPSFPDPTAYTCRDITLTYYDRARESSDPTFTQENLRTRVSWTAMVERDAVDTVFTLYSYDPHGNVKALLQDLPGIGEPKRTEYRYDLVSGNVNLVLYQYGRPDQFIHRYSYDADNRIEEVHTSTDGYVWNREAKYTYYPHGPLARVELGEYNVQGMDYYYTLQGWLKGVNMPTAGDPGEDGVRFRTGTDAFAFALGYYEGDYKPINPTAVVSDTRDKLGDRYRETRDTVSAAGLYNGNISWMSTDLPGLGSNRMQAMVYGYDQLHRIVQARSLTVYGANGYEARATGPQAYDTDYSYDPNGNLLTLQRRDDSQTAVRDDLTYEYNIGTNRLRNTDTADGENYTYDEVGNLISDAEEGIDSIVWTPYGKVRKVEKADNSSVSFRYDAAGNRIAKIAGSDTTVYVRDASGNVMGVYKNDTLVEQSIYGSSRLGLMTTSSKTGYRTLGGKKYELSNHLGNVLAVVTDNIHLDQDSTWASVINMTDYYPFGLAMDGRTVQDSSYRYGFNTQEKVDEIKGSGNHYTAEFWEYNPRVVHRWNVDPKPNPSFSNYAIMQGSPIWFSDPLGDTVRVSYKGSDLTYNDNKFFNSNGSEYGGKGIGRDGSYKGFLGETLNAINSIAKGAEGKNLIDELVSSENVFTINKGPKNLFSANSPSKAGANITEVQEATGNKVGSTGSGGTIYWNPNITESGFDTDGKRTRPAYIGLAHELFHGRDANQGQLHFDNDYTNGLTGATYHSTQSGLKKSEWRAVYFENVLRGQVNIHRRTHYGIQETAPGVFSPDGPKLLNENGNPINYPNK
jgi:YD repeat-containing protein